MSWFENLTGFQEVSPPQVRCNLTVEGEVLTSLINGRSYVCGRLETPSLAELRRRAMAMTQTKGKITVREVIANVQDLHTDPANANAVFQVASQFNLLEMVSPDVIPENGVAIYEHDHTQGPSCAMAAGAGTIYRNYFAPVNGQTGQTAHNQIDCLADLGAKVGNADNCLWQMCNGYALATLRGLTEISSLLRSADERERDELRQLLRIGIQWNTQVTLNNANHNVTQAYCSALPVAYSQHAAELWEPFARLVLEATYEATFCTGIVNLQATGVGRVFLTLVGGGVFGNLTEWIVDSIKRALVLYRDRNLDVAIVSFRRPNPAIKELLTERC